MLLARTNELLEYKREMDETRVIVDPGIAFVAERRSKQMETDLSAVQVLLLSHRTIVSPCTVFSVPLLPFCTVIISKKYKASWSIAF